MTLTALSLSMLVSANVTAADLIEFWHTPQHGANIFNRLPANADVYPDLHDYNASWIRLAYDKWPSKQRDFLIGDADNYQGLVKEDLALLKQEIEKAGQAGLKVVIAPLSLPLYRWSQNNGNQFDSRLFDSKQNWQVAIQFWVDLALALKDSPYVAAYNILNEPAPEKRHGLAEHASSEQMKAWYQQHQGGSRDLPLFYQTITDAIRDVDPVTPIMLDSGWYAAADGFNYWLKPINDDKVLYSFHMYEPYQATSSPNLRRDQPYVYPGEVPFADAKPQRWDKSRVARYLQQPVDWANMHGIPTQHLVAGEFGCVRKMNSCATYLDDVITALDSNQLHWAFYSFREDAWDAMNYELGEKGTVGWDYWKAEQNGTPDPTHYQSSPLFSVISDKL
ncbi:glycoside hydrolase family 5 protein [Vibrio sp. JPW-9-11-11]|nr:glycoside hydrolase family 5 protein [Vibrio sp. JPW-9-11-11]